MVALPWSSSTIGSTSRWRLLARPRSLSSIVRQIAAGMTCAVLHRRNDTNGSSKTTTVRDLYEPRQQHSADLVNGSAWL